MSEYFVRNGRKLAGPFEVFELQQMAAIGRINRSTLVSADQQNWIPAAHLSSVFPEYAITVRSPIDVPSGDVVVVCDSPAVPPVDRRYWCMFRGPLLIAVLCLAMFFCDMATGRHLGLVNLVMPVDELLLHDANDDARIRKAVGFVICGRSEMDTDGELLEVPISTGSGFLVSHDGFLLTNKHVVEDIAPYTQNPSLFKNDIPEERYKQLRMVDAILRVYLDGVSYPARIISMSDRYDMAILRINTSNSPYFALSEAESFTRNQNVFAVGFPSGASTELTTLGEVEAIVRKNVAKSITTFFDESDFTYTQTTGAISRLENKSGAGGVIQHTANINKGNSGGPLIDESGRVVGINTFGVIDQNTFYAVKLVQMKAEIDAIVPHAVWK